MRFTLRRMMTLVAVTAVLIWLATMVPAFLDAVIDDSFYGAEKMITKTWNPGPTPKVNIDLFAGYIDVVQSTGLFLRAHSVRIPKSGWTSGPMTGRSISSRMRSGRQHQR